MRIVLIFISAAALALPAPFTAASEQPSLSVKWLSSETRPAAALVEASGFTPAELDTLSRSNWTTTQWNRLLSIYVEPPGLLSDAALPPMLGAYRVVDQSVRFEPDYPIEPGLLYRAVLDPKRRPDSSARTGDAISANFKAPPRPDRAASSVTQIFPTSDLLPENLLKFYVHFSAPMSRGRIYDHIRLIDDDGRTIELPFLEIDEELWNREMTRVTLFIDPGRIKRGVRPLEEIGPSLEQGKRYTLRIEPEWRDAFGKPLRAPFIKNFKIGPPDRSPPDPANWKVHSPRPGTTDPLTIRFDEPIDHALARRFIGVRNHSGEEISGTAALEDNERLLKFQPAQRWNSGPHAIVVRTTIEDLAGNNVGKPFEVDVFDGVERHLTADTVSIPFEVR